MSQNDQIPFNPVAGGFIPAAVGAGGIGQATLKGAVATATGTGIVVVNCQSFIPSLQTGQLGCLVTPHGATAQGIKMDVTLSGQAATVNTYRGDTGAAIWVPLSILFFVIPVTT